MSYKHALTLAPQIAQGIRKAIDQGLSLGQVERMIGPNCAIAQSCLGSEAELQRLWVAITRRPELASVHAQVVAQALIDDSKVRTQAWMLDLARYRGPWLPGGVVWVKWSVVGSNLSKKARGEGPSMGVLAKVPDLEHCLEGQASWYVELKWGRGTPDKGQRAVMKAMKSAGHRVTWGKTVKGLALGMVEAITNCA